LTPQTTKRTTSWAVYLTLFIIAALSLIFLFEFVNVSQSEMVGQSTTTAGVDSARVSALLANADASNGAALVTAYGCAACHRSPTHIAPSFVGIAERAATRRPPLSAAEYVYESITNPTAYVVDGFQPAMPPNYPERLTDQELGDIIAYLLSGDAE
jgi:cytochrome c551/c552